MIRRKKVIEKMGLVTWNIFYLLFDLLVTSIFLCPIYIIFGISYPYNWYIYIVVHAVRTLMKYIKRKRYFPRVSIEACIRDDNTIDLDVKVKD